jgi:hypothetical protein
MSFLPQTLPIVRAGNDTNDSTYTRIASGLQVQRRISHIHDLSNVRNPARFHGAKNHIGRWSSPAHITARNIGRK